MATKHNITLAIDPALLKKARAVAARRGRSVSALLAVSCDSWSRRIGSTHRHASEHSRCYPARCHSEDVP